MVLQIEKSENYAESNIAYIGLTRRYGKSQYILVDSDEGKNPKLKFPGSRFRAPLSGKTLEDVAMERFEEQTGLEISQSLGLRTILPARSRHTGQWVFRNVFVGIIDDEGDLMKRNDGRKVYVVDAGNGQKNGQGFAYKIGDVEKRIPIRYVTEENQLIARTAKNILDNFDWKERETEWLRKIPVLESPPQTDSDSRELGCALAVSSIFLTYRPSPDKETHIILLKRKGDMYPGYGGGKIETLKNLNSKNLSPISCCVEEGKEEYGFDIQPLGLLGIACTPIDMPSQNHFNGIINYTFIAEPRNPLELEEALKKPKKYLESNMECYVIEGMSKFRDRIREKRLRMPDMSRIGKEFFKGTPGSRIPLTQIFGTGTL
ncbi:hypothetical protein HYT25_00435 [Candidatus Pacearchaeota archaeon]|nr:hypothetical protein [Candidatus Pacearchaeota archaeon]